MQAFRWPLGFATLIFIATTTIACEDDSSADDPPPLAGEGGTSPPPSADAITESVLAACPQSSTLIETVEWPSCLAGRRVAGTEPFNNAPCELRIGENGAFEYRRSGTVALTIPPRTGWRAASGTYQNELNVGRRIFLASVAPDVPAVEGQPRITRINLGFFTLADETVEIQYLDAALARQTYNCKVDVL